MRTRRRRSRSNMASSAGRPISTRPWPRRTTRSSSMPQPRRCGRLCSKRRPPPASTTPAGLPSHCEKPTATTLAEAMKVCQLAEKSGLKHGVVQDKIFLPGLMKLKFLRDSGFFGRMLSVRGEFGYWVFEGDLQPIQRPSWNYKLAEGGGIILDMLCHWRYVLDNTFAEVKAVSCIGTTHIPQRWDEDGKAYKADADDAAYATFQLDGGIIPHINSSWCVRPYRDDLVTFQVDGTHGSAVAGLHDCMMQSRQGTPRPGWDPDQQPNPG